MPKANPSRFRKFAFIALFGAMSPVALRLVSKPSTNLLQGVLSPLPTLTLGNTADEPGDVAKFFAVKFGGHSPEEVLDDGHTVYEHALYTGTWNKTTSNGNKSMESILCFF